MEDENFKPTFSSSKSWKKYPKWFIEGKKWKSYLTVWMRVWASHDSSFVLKDLAKKWHDSKDYSSWCYSIAQHLINVLPFTWTQLFFSPSWMLMSAHLSMTARISSIDIRGRVMSECGWKHITWQLPLTVSHLSKGCSDSPVKRSLVSNQEA